MLRLLLATLVAFLGATATAEPVLKQVYALTDKGATSVVKWRRHIHQYPELSNREKQTGAYIAKQLKVLGINKIQTNVAGHGVVALIEGKLPGKTVALRADIDALPVTEKTSLPFASKNTGVMHACGHDVHTAVLLGAAQVLNEMREHLHGTVKLVFQPAEEGPPLGEEGGAPLMIKEGVLENPKVGAIFALHVDPSIPAGALGYVMGGIMAAVDQFKVTITGKQVHAAYPAAGIDPIVTAAHMVTALQTLSSRVIDTRDTVVMSVGKIHGGQRWNIIPRTVTLEGTVRTHDTAIRKVAKDSFMRIVNNTAKAHRATASITYHDMAPVTFNNPKLGTSLLASLARAVGQENVLQRKPAMGGEDFAFYAQKIPGFYVRLGVRNASIGATHSLHTPGFMVDEAALKAGVRTMSLMALDYLKANQ